MEWHSRLLAKSSPQNSFLPMMDETSSCNPMKHNVHHTKQGTMPYMNNFNNKQSRPKSNFPLGIGIDFVGKMAQGGIDLGLNSCCINPYTKIQNQKKTPAASSVSQSEPHMKQVNDRSVGANFLNFVVGGFVGSKSQMHMEGREYPLNLQYMEEWNNLQHDSYPQQNTGPTCFNKHQDNFVQINPFPKAYVMYPPDLNMYGFVSYNQSEIFMAPHVMPCQQTPSQAAFRYFSYPHFGQVQPPVLNSPQVQSRVPPFGQVGGLNATGVAPVVPLEKYQSSFMVHPSVSAQLSVKCEPVPPAPPISQPKSTPVITVRQSYAEVAKIPSVMSPVSVDRPMRLPYRRTRWRNNMNNSPRWNKRKTAPDRYLRFHYGNGGGQDQTQQNNQTTCLGSQKKQMTTWLNKQNPVEKCYVNNRIGPPSTHFSETINDNKTSKENEERCHRMSNECKNANDCRPTITGNTFFGVHNDSGSDHQCTKPTVVTEVKNESIEIVKPETDGDGDKVCTSISSISSFTDSKEPVVTCASVFKPTEGVTCTLSDSDEKASLIRCRLVSSESGSDENTSLSRCRRVSSESGSDENTSLSRCRRESSTSESVSSNGSRLRYLSECSVDSEDSLVVVFQDGCCLDEDDNDSLLYSCSELSDADEIDEVDFICPKSRCALENSGQESSSDEDDDSDYVSVPNDASSPLVITLEDCKKVRKGTSGPVPDGHTGISKRKKVQFAEGPELAVVHTMVAWDYAYRAARPGPWEAYARDRERFKHRIERCSEMLAPILCAEHRAKVWKRIHGEQKRENKCAGFFCR